jgi:hypothetical protein
MPVTNLPKQDNGGASRTKPRCRSVAPDAKKMSDKHYHPGRSLATDSFVLWQDKNFAQHMAVAAQAMALMRAHHCFLLTLKNRTGKIL